MIKQNRIGETRLTTCGLKATVIDYINAHKVTIKFENGVEKVTTWERFNSGRITPVFVTDFVPQKERIGLKVKQHCGSVAELIEYKRCDDILVRFVDTGIVRKTTWNNFYKTKAVLNSQKRESKKLLNTKHTNFLGLAYKVIDVQSTHNVTIRFDLTGLTKTVSSREIKNNIIGYPGFRGKGVQHNHITGVRSLVTNKGVYFKCTCSNCEFSSLMTASDILSHTC